MDDVLVNFDDEGRQAAAAAAIAEFAKERQVVFFTCHDRVADAVRRGGARPRAPHARALLTPRASKGPPPPAASTRWRRPLCEKARC